MTPLRIGLVGAGSIAHAYVQAMRQSSDGRLAAVADVRLDAAQALAEGGQCAAWDSVGAMLAGTPCDAAIVCTPPATHPAICRTLLERRIPVLCEKPLCIGSAEAAALAALAQDTGVLFTMATKFRFVDDVVAARSMVASKVVGDVLMLENAFTARVDMTQRWNSDPRVSGGGVLIDNGTHSVDLVRFFLGPITEVHAAAGRRMQPIEVEDSAQLWVRTRADVLGTIDLSWSVNKEQETYLQVHGTQGTIRVGWKRSVYKQLSSSQWVEFGTGYDKVRAFANQIRNFCRAVRGEEAPLVSLEDALASVQVIEAAYRSLQAGKWVALNGAGGMQ